MKNSLTKVHCNLCGNELQDMEIVTSEISNQDCTGELEIRVTIQGECTSCNKTLRKVINFEVIDSYMMGKTELGWQAKHEFRDKEEFMKI